MGGWRLLSVIIQEENFYFHPSQRHRLNIPCDRKHRTDHFGSKSRGFSDAFMRRSSFTFSHPAAAPHNNTLTNSSQMSLLTFSGGSLRPPCPPKEEEEAEEVELTQSGQEVDQGRHVRVKEHRRRVSVPPLEVRARYDARSPRRREFFWWVVVRDGARRVTCAVGCGRCRGPPRTAGLSEHERRRVRVAPQAKRAQISSYLCCFVVIMSPHQTVQQ